MNTALDVIDESAAIALPSQPVLVPLASPSCREVCTALAAAQGEFETPKRTKEATVRGTTRSGGSYDYKYKYAPLEEIISAVKVALAKNGLFRQQYLVTKGGMPLIRTIIWHTSGEWIASDYPVHQSKDGAQGFAAGVTYARRYGLSLALGLAPEDDDDANEDAKIVDTPGRRAPRIGPNVMQSPVDATPGTAASPSIEDASAPAGEDEAASHIMAWDKMLIQAAGKGTVALQAAWQTVPARHQHALQAAKDRRYKPMAAEFDQEQESIRREREWAERNTGENND